MTASTASTESGHPSLREFARALPDSVTLTNGEVELLLPTAFGPRILGYARTGGPNVFGVVPATEQAVQTSYPEPWHIYGGHRLWAAPEHPLRSYYPDNQPVRVEHSARRAVLKQQPELDSGLEKSIEIELDVVGSGVTVLHRLVHRGRASLELAPWALTVMAEGGEAWIPQPAFVPHPTALAPARPLVVWPFTQMDDPRWSWGARFIRLRQTADKKGAPDDAQKVGLFNDSGWLAYTIGDDVFIKMHPVRRGPHADFGCNQEVFTNSRILELESLGPLTMLEPGQEVEHQEHWFLFARGPGDDEDCVRRAVARAATAAKTDADTSNPARELEAAALVKKGAGG